MRVALKEPGALVVDDVLDPYAFDAVGHEIARGDYASVHARGLDKAWRLTDGNPQRGLPVYYDPTAAINRPGIRYPTASVVDQFVDTLRDLTVRHPQVVGTEGVDWAAIFLSPWLYPVGSALSLHRDGGDYSGAFTFFTHPEWGIHWGGELLLFDETDDASINDHMREAGASESLIATCVFPRPNRLALLGPRRAHMIGRVDANAGEHVRTSLAGFFLRS